ncbi:MAG: Gx transporter family protein [Bacilli bacterium]|nr:Gx transporter family protein [Bacilli bacterium]
MSTNSKRIRTLSRLSMFLAIGIILNIVESMIPLPLPIPGVKLGLANTIGLIVLYYYGPKEYLSIGFLRVLIVGFLRTGIISIAFALSLSGWFLSSIITLVAYFFKKFSIYFLSILSATFHTIGQMIVVMIIYSTYGLIFYFPVLLITSIITGCLVAFVSAMVLQKLDKAVFKNSFKDQKEVVNE